MGNTLQKEIKQALSKKNITMKEMCKKLNFPYGTLRLQLHNGSISYWRMQELANFLDLDVVHLMTLVNDVKKSKRK